MARNRKPKLSKTALQVLLSEYAHSPGIQNGICAAHIEAGGSTSDCKTVGDRFEDMMAKFADLFRKK